MDSLTSNRAITFLKYSFPSKIGAENIFFPTAICRGEPKQKRLPLHNLFSPGFHLTFKQSFRSQHINLLKYHHLLFALFRTDIHNLGHTLSTPDTQIPRVATLFFPNTRNNLTNVTSGPWTMGGEPRAASFSKQTYYLE